MIAHRHRVVMQSVHRQHHRIGRCVVVLVMKVFERRSLNRVARIEQEQIGVILARLFDQRGNFRDPDVVVFVRVVINRKDAAVHVSRAEDDNMRARGRACPARDREQNG